jgi:hypothetical protein
MLTTPFHDDPDANINIVQDYEHGLEFHATYVNEHGTGHATLVSNPQKGMVDIVFTQVVDGDIVEESEVSISLPPAAVGALLRALNLGLNVALHQQRTRKYN